MLTTAEMAERLGFAEVVAGLLGMPLDRFAEAGQVIEVRVPWWPEPLFFVPSEPAAERLVSEGISRGRVWTGSRRRAFAWGPRPFAGAKFTFDGDVVAVVRVVLQVFRVVLPGPRVRVHERVPWSSSASTSVFLAVPA